MVNHYKIAMVAACPLPANYGSPASIKEMSEILYQRGHEVHVVTYPYGQDVPFDCPNLHRVKGSKDSAVGVGPSHEKPLLDLRMLVKLYKVVRKHKIDVIHAHNYEGALIGIVIHWLTGVPLLYNSVNTMADELSSYDFIKPKCLTQFIAKSLDWFVPKCPNHITIVSEEQVEFLKDQGVPANKISLVPAGVIPEVFANPDKARFRKELGLSDLPIVCYTGTLGKFQRIDHLLNAWPIVLKSEPNSVLAIIFSIVEADMLAQHKAHAERLGISESIRWIGPHELSDLPDLLAMADVATVPRAECPGHPVKLLNYQVAKVPVVSFEGSAKGLTHLKSCYAARNHDVDDFAAGIIKVLQDKEFAAKIRDKAYEILINELTWDALCSKIEKIYANLLYKTDLPPEAFHTRTHT